MLTASDLAAKCTRAKLMRNGQWQACCPAHEDAHPSLSIADGEQGVVLHCHAGCEPAAIVAALGVTLKELFTAPLSANGHTLAPGEDWMATPAPALHDTRRVVACYEYTDVLGTVVLEVLRYEPKDFRQRQPDPAHPGQYLWHTQGINKPLYHLPYVAQAIAQHQPVYLVEGEKDADALHALGCVATTNAGGANAWEPHYVSLLAGAQLILLPDNDRAGRKHAATIASSLLGFVASLRVLFLPGLLEKGDVSDWLAQGGTVAQLAALVEQTPEWDGNVASILVGPTLPTAPVGFDGTPAVYVDPLGRAWRELLNMTKGKHDKTPVEDLHNIGLFLAYHPYWAGRFWWDTLRQLPMLDEETVSKRTLVQIAQWLGANERMSVNRLGNLRDCVETECQKQPRDLLQIWLNTLPPWDGVVRLPTWLRDVAGVPDTPYGTALSRLLPLSMVARAYEPGCLYRYVIILEGAENTGKSTLVQKLGGDGWTEAVSMSLESKESHMTLQGRWLVELPELDSYNRTSEARLKAFITLREDAWFPKYSNTKMVAPRRTIFIATTNESVYFNGQTGNTRFLPITTGAMHLELLDLWREQLFAEAIATYRADPTRWWVLPDEVLAIAVQAREERRIANVYESALEDWLETGRFADYLVDVTRRDTTMPQKNETSWPEIAQYFLKIDKPENWKDQRLQKQIADALRKLGWEDKVIRKGKRTQRVWLKTVTADV